MIEHAVENIALVSCRERYRSGIVMGDGVMFGAKLVAMQLRSHIEECGRRYEIQRDEVRGARTELSTARSELTLELAKLRTDQFLMDERNRKSIQSVFSLLWCVAGGIILTLMGIVGVLVQAQFHIHP